MQTALYILMAVLVTVLVCAIAAYIHIRRYTIGCFVLDISPSNPLATFQLEKLPEDFENVKMVFVRIEKQDISLPGTHKSQ